MPMAFNIQNAKSVLIVGAGNFGAATALSLKKKRPDLDVCVVDATTGPNPYAASHDINKIVRDDYPDELYMRMMHKAMPKWRNESDIYRQFYHEVGMLRPDPGSFGTNSLATYAKLGADTEAGWLSVPEVRSRFNGAFADGTFDGLDKIYWNPGCGWAEAEGALGSVIEAAKDAGVRFVAGSVEKLLVEERKGGRCSGVALKNGGFMRADAVLLATGARTPALLVDSAPERTDLHAEDRLVATGAVSFTGTLKGQQKEKYTNVPVCKNVLPQVKGEGMSMTSDGVIKCNCDMSFTNSRKHPVTGQKMSFAPDDDKFLTWIEGAFSKKFEERALQVLRGLYGKGIEGMEIEKYRMCWDATTPTHDFLIAPHPHSDGLFLATGGSFHGWKFLPVIGDYIVAMMEGTLEDEYAARWAWDKKDGSGKCANPTYDIAFDLAESEWLEQGA